MDSITLQSSEITELAKALIAVQKELEPAVKDGTKPFMQNTYATLNSVMESCRNSLLKHNIWLTQYPVPAEHGHVGLMTKLTHAESGQWQGSLAVVPLPKSDPQAYGSCLTYCRRYALSAMLGIVCEDDDAEASKPKKSQTKSVQTKTTEIMPKKSDEQFKDLPKLDGVTYQNMQAHDGKTCILALGSTQAKKEMLMASGFKWNTQRKLWWKYAHVAA